MPYKRKIELPDNVKGVLPSHAQEIFKEAFNNSWKYYSDSKKRNGSASREEVANKVAWSAVKSKFKKNNKGDWVEK